MTSILPTTLSPIVTPDETTTKHAPPIGLCALPVNPEHDTNLNKDSGFRFGII